MSAVCVERETLACCRGRDDHLELRGIGRVCFGCFWLVRHDDIRCSRCSPVGLFSSWRFYLLLCEIPRPASCVSLSSNGHSRFMSNLIELVLFLSCRESVSRQRGRTICLAHRVLHTNKPTFFAHKSMTTSQSAADVAAAQRKSLRTKLSLALACSLPTSKSGLCVHACVSCCLCELAKIMAHARALCCFVTTSY